MFPFEIILYISGGNLRQQKGIVAIYKENIFILSRSGKNKYEGWKPTIKLWLL